MHTPAPLPRPRAILFDLDGTLLDSAPDLAAAVQRQQRERNLAQTPFPLLRPQASKGARGLLKVGFGLQPGDAGFEELRLQFLDYYEAAMMVHSRLFEGVPQLLAHLQEQGIAWGIVTNKLARFTDALLPQAGLAHAACAISGDTTPYAKPHPAPLLAACAALHLQPQECWYAGDDARDIAAAHAAGMPGLACAWGYCEAEEVAGWGADWIGETPTDMLALVQRIGAARPTL